ncbi:MAG: glycosyltransferase family 4 protein, partial [Elusimicrobiota bacterium]
NIVGSGDHNLIKKLQSLCCELKLESDVFFLGKISEHVLEERYKSCDVFCLPSIVDSRGDTEGLGVVLLEAMNYGRPVVGSSVGGIPDIIKDGQTGLLCKEKNPQDIAEKITMILEDRSFAQRLASQGCEFARQEFGWDKIISLWEDFYSDVLR